MEVVGDSTRAGDFALVRLEVSGERIVAADAPGLDRSVEGLTLIEAAAVTGEPLAVDALAHALGQVFHAAPMSGRVAVAMSGGVDSAVALLRAGDRAVGVTLRLWIDPEARAADRACCSSEAVFAARQACHDRGLPHVTLDLRNDFRDAVVAGFVRDYATGLTPNPCVRCNGAFRFDALVEFARRAGAEKLWTGHYARIVDRDGRRFVAQAADPEKDQSYMLATVPPALLRHVVFPLGEQTKADTRAEASAAGLAVAGRAESQEACFLGGDDYRVFLERQGVKPAPGPVVDLAGSVLGRHDGTWRYTVGQRRGLGVSAVEPLYAVETRPETATLVVGPREALAVRTVDVDGDLYLPPLSAEVKLRYRSPGVAARVVPRESGFTCELAQPVYGVAAGQTAVVYDSGIVVGAGMVRRASG